MRTIRLTPADLARTAFKDGDYLDAGDYDHLVHDSAVVQKPNGTILLAYIADAIPQALCDVAYRDFKDVRFESRNRAMGGERQFPIKRDGTRSRTSQTSEPVNSGVVGYFDREPRTPYCRMTRFTMDYPEVFTRMLPFVTAVNDVFRTHAHERWDAQRAFVGCVSPEFVISGTVFTTMTVNRNFRTRAHRDKGDYQPGLGVMMAMGRFGGGELIFPEFRTAVAMRTGGVCLADVHELHGNAPIVGRPDTLNRVSFVFYARARMTACGTPAEELRHARTVGAG